MIRSKFVAALALSATLGVGAASAADLPAWPYAKAPPLPYAVYNWAGFYVGGHLGGSSSSEIWTNTANTTRFGDLGPQQGFSQRGTGVFGGGQIGYNWQASNYVFGLEGTISAMDNRGSLLNTVFGAKDDVFSSRTNWMATVTGSHRHRGEQQSVLRQGRLCRRDQSHGSGRCGPAIRRLGLGYALA